MKEISIKIQDVEIKALLANTPALQAHGLSDRVSLGEHKGMLFIFSKPARYDFWMKDMHFPLDIVWIDADRRVVDISYNILPSTFPKIFYPIIPAQYVLEINSGEAKKLGIEKGLRLEFSL